MTDAIAKTLDMQDLPEQEILPVRVDTESSSTELAPSSLSSDDDLLEDYKESRDNLKQLIQQSQEAIQNMASLSQGLESPRAFEVLSGMMKEQAEMTKQLMELQKSIRELENMKHKDNSSPQNIGEQTNIAYVGKTEDLLDLIEQKKKNGKQPK